MLGIRRLLGLAVTLLLIAALPAAATIGRPTSAAVDPALPAELDAPPTERPAVVFVHGQTLTQARQAVESAGLRPVTEWTSIDVVVAAGAPAAVRAVTREAGVTYVEPNTEITWSMESARKASRAHEAITTDWAARATRQQCERQLSRQREACESSTPGTTFDGAGRSIAIIDSGVDGRHPMFMRPDGRSRVVRNMRVLCPGTSLLEDPKTGAESPDDACLRSQSGPIQVVDVPNNDSDTPTAGGHGTHVAGIAAGREVVTRGRTLSGVAPGASIVSLSTNIGVGVAGANTALDWIVRNHKAPCGPRSTPAECPPITVVNNSYGPSGGDFRSEQAVVKLQRRLVELGIVMVWANGNDGGTGSENLSNPAGQDPTPGVISVANYDDLDSGSRAGIIDPSSSRGDRTRVATFPDIAAPGTAITSACRRTLPLCSSGDADPDYGTISGTSMATPHVSGAVAVLQQALEASSARVAPKDRPGPAAIEDILEDTAVRFPFAGRYVADYVDGEPVARNADSPTSFDKGHGLIDLAAAMASVFGVEGIAVPGSTDCPPPTRQPVVTDREGDATVDALEATGRTTPVDDPALDVLAAWFDGDPRSLVVTLTIQVKDLAVAPRHRGERWIASFWAGDAAHELDIQRLPGVNEYVRTIDGAGGGQVTFDTNRDQVVFEAPAEFFSPPLVGPTRIDGLAIDSLAATAVAISFTADHAATACAGTVDAGIAPIDPDPVAGSGEGRVERDGPAHEWSGRAPVPANAVPIGDLACPTASDRRCAHHKVEVAVGGTRGATFRLVVSFPAGDDIDVFVYDRFDQQLGSATTDNRADGTTEEVIEIVHARPGVYRVSVSSWLAPSGGNFKASATLA